MERLSSNLGNRPRAVSWPTALIAIVIVRAVVSYAVKPGSPLLSYGVTSYWLLLLLATGFAIRNAIQLTLGSRAFWVLLAIGYSLWALDQSIFMFHEFVLHTDVPDNSIADPVLFLHIVPLIAAVAIIPNQSGSGSHAISSAFQLALVVVFLGLSLCLRRLSLPVFVLQHLCLCFAIRHPLPGRKSGAGRGYGYFDPARAAPLEGNLSPFVGRVCTLRHKFCGRQLRNRLRGIRLWKAIWSGSNRLCLLVCLAPPKRMAFRRRRRRSRPSDWTRVHGFGLGNARSRFDFCSHCVGAIPE